MPASSSSETVWGKMLGAIGTGIKITASAFVFLFTSVALYHFVGDLWDNGVMGGTIRETITNLWHSATAAASTAWNTVDGFLNDILTALPSRDETMQWLTDAYHNDNVRMGAAAVGIGAGLYAGYKWTQAVKSETNLPPRIPTEPNYNEFRLLKERLDQARSAGYSRA